ncbi:MAG: hypothetical protein WB607_07185, partial [Candidatus Acidiferrum sp.]
FERDTLRFKCRLDDTLDELREVDRLTVTVRNSQPLAGLPRFACHSVSGSLTGAMSGAEQSDFFVLGVATTPRPM